MGPDPPTPAPNTTPPTRTTPALAVGRPAHDRFEVDAPLALTGSSAVRVRMHVHAEGLPSVTAFEVLERRTAPDGTPLALLACRPRTGDQRTPGTTVRRSIQRTASVSAMPTQRRFDMPYVLVPCRRDR